MTFIEDMKNDLENIKQLLNQEISLCGAELNEEDKEKINGHIDEKEKFINHVNSQVSSIFSGLINQDIKFREYLNYINTHTQKLSKLIQTEKKEIGDNEKKDIILQEISYMEAEIGIMNKTEDKLEIIGHSLKHHHNSNEEMNEKTFNERYTHLEKLGLKVNEINKHIVGEICSNRIYKFLILIEKQVEPKHIKDIFSYGITEILKQTQPIEQQIQKKQFINFMQKLVEITKNIKSGNIENIFFSGIGSILQTKSIELLIINNQFTMFMARLVEITKNTKLEDVNDIFQYGIRELLRENMSIELLIQKKQFINFMGKIVEITKIKNLKEIWKIIGIGIVNIIGQIRFIELIIKNNQFIEFMEELVVISKNAIFEKNWTIYYYGIVEIIKTNTILFSIENNKFIEIIEQYGQELVKIVNQNKIESEEFIENIIVFFNGFFILLMKINRKEDLNLITNYFKSQINNSKDKIRTIMKLDYFEKHTELTNIIYYYLEYDPKKFVDFIQTISLIKELNLKLDIDFFYKLSKPLIYMNKKELEETFEDKEKLKNIYLKLCKRNENFKQKNKFEGKLNEIIPIFSSIKKHGEKFTSEKISKKREKLFKYFKINFFISPSSQTLFNFLLVDLSKMFANQILLFFEKVRDRKIRDKLLDEFELEKYDSSFITFDFLEVYKMYSSENLMYNKLQAKKLLQIYLEKNTFPQNKDLFNSYPFNEQANIDWLEKQTFNKEKWFNENKKTINVKSGDIEKLKEKRIGKYFKIANEKLSLLELNKQEDYTKLLNFFKTLKKENFKDKENIFKDLVTQINGIYTYLRNSKTQKSNEIIIYQELNPIKICLMGNLVDNSCLSFYNPTANFYSCFSNAIDINKSVFYIKSKNKIIGRVLCAFTKEGKLVRFELYEKGVNIVDLDNYFNIYINDLANKCKIELNKGKISGSSFEDLVCEEWYYDGFIEFM